MLVQVSDPVSHYFIECISFPSPNDVIRLRLLILSSFSYAACSEVVSDVAENSGVGFLHRMYRPLE